MPLARVLVRGGREHSAGNAEETVEAAHDAVRAERPLGADAE